MPDEVETPDPGAARDAFKTLIKEAFAEVAAENAPAKNKTAPPQPDFFSSLAGIFGGSK